MTTDFNEPVWTQLSVQEYNERIDGADFSRSDFYNDPVGYRSTFMKYAAISDLYIACHYWDSRSPFLFTRDDMKLPEWKVGVVADISCDIDGPVACTLRPSTIDNPIYGYDRLTEQEVDYLSKDSIAVMAVDNLPCELPKDASSDFGSEFIEKVLPNILNGDLDQVIERATITRQGQLTEKYVYLEDYAQGKIEA